MMATRSLIAWEELTAWSTLAAAVGTIAAVAAALWQAGKARKEATSERKYRNWLEQKRLEEGYLTRTLEAVATPFETAIDFFYSGVRLLAGIPPNIAPTQQQGQAVTDFLDRFANQGHEAERILHSYINILGALRELHRTRGDVEIGKRYGELIQKVDEAFRAAADLREWLADENKIRSLRPDRFDDLPQFARARDAAYEAERAIARYLVRIYENPPSP